MRGYVQNPQAQGNPLWRWGRSTPRPPLVPPRKRLRASCPATTERIVAEARQRFEQLLHFCVHNERSFWTFEKCLLALLAVLGRLLVRLCMTSRHQRLDLQPYLQDGAYRLDNAYAKR